MTLVWTEARPIKKTKTASRLRSYLLTAYVTFFFCFLYLPILLLIALSVNDSQVMTATFHGFTWRWYETVVATEGLVRSIFSSLVLGLVSSSIATGLAVLMALGFRHDFPLKPLMMKIILLPILIPGVVSGVVFLMFFGYAGISQGLWTTVLPAHVTWVLPFAFLTVFPRINGLDRSLEEAAMDLGATRPMVFRRVILPQIQPAIVATILFGFTLSFDEFIRTFFISGRDRTVPVYLWELLSDQMAPFLPAVGVVVTAISVFASLLGFVVSAWAGRKGANASH
ncbi:ABC transporter permease [Xanthobacter sp. VNH20]|uniref:ABC transporter permease n=1 Tax=Xanthobacter sp. VNH20 TaxID=3156616 RepID=UPI0032B4946D